MPQVENAFSDEKKISLPAIEKCPTECMVLLLKNHPFLGTLNTVGLFFYLLVTFGSIEKANAIINNFTFAISLARVSSFLSK